jgi:hypothetical protein
VAAGIFLPGVIHGNNFVPGVTREGRFSPGVFTFDQQFVPGRFVSGRFESGVAQGTSFVRSSFQSMTVDETRSLPGEGYGLAKLDRFAPLGGIPIGGLVIGKLPDGLGYLPCGIATNRVLIPGGIGPGENLRVVDPMAKIEDLLASWALRSTRTALRAFSAKTERRCSSGRRTRSTICAQARSASNPASTSRVPSMAYPAA